MLALLLPSSTAFAAKGDKQEAKIYFKAGAKLYKAGKYAAALPKLLEANRLDPNHKLVKNIVKIYEKMENIKGAAAFLQQVVDSRRPKKALKFAKKRLKQYETKLKAVEEAKLEELKRQAAAQASSEAEAAKAEAVKAKAEAATAKAEAEQAKADQAKAEAQVAKAPLASSGTGSAGTGSSASGGQGGGPNYLAYGLLGLGVASAVPWAIFGIKALDKTADDQQETALKSDIFMISTIALAGTGVALLLTSDGGGGGSTSLLIGPTGIALTGSF